jgi:hypothetical protein
MADKLKKGGNGDGDGAWSDAVLNKLLSELRNKYVPASLFCHSLVWALNLHFFFAPPQLMNDCFHRSRNPEIRAKAAKKLKNHVRCIQILFILHFHQSWSYSRLSYFPTWSTCRWYVTQVATQAREMSSEHFTRFMNDLTNKHIFELVNSQVVHEKIGGIMAIGPYQPQFTPSSSLTTVNNNLTCVCVVCVVCAASR